MISQYNSNYFQEPTFPTPDGKTEDDAIAKCKEALDNAPAFANCDIDKEAIMNDCVADVKVDMTQIFYQFLLIFSHILIIYLIFDCNNA